MVQGIWLPDHLISGPMSIDSRHFEKIIQFPVLLGPFFTDHSISGLEIECTDNLITGSQLFCQSNVSGGIQISRFCIPTIFVLVNCVTHLLQSNYQLSNNHLLFFSLGRHWRERVQRRELEPELEPAQKLAMSSRQKTRTEPKSEPLLQASLHRQHNQATNCQLQSWQPCPIVWNWQPCSKDGQRSGSLSVINCQTEIDVINQYLNCGEKANHTR
jgi:hypothetical protein